MSRHVLVGLWWTLLLSSCTATVSGGEGGDPGPGPGGGEGADAGVEGPRCSAPEVEQPKTNPNLVPMWSLREWSFENPTYSGNPFDLEARATFTHAESGEQRVTELFYAGGSTWKLRFTPTREGLWSFSTESSDSELAGHSGAVEVGPAEKGQTGFLIAQGDKWVLEGRGPIIPQYAMGAVPVLLHQQPEKLDLLVDTFIRGHRFTGLHVPVSCAWFNVETDLCHGVTADSNPDLRTFDVLDRLLLETREAGGLVHFWMWGDSDHYRNPKDFSGLNVSADRRLQRYLAARLGAIPNWSVGYGYDLWEWVTDAELRDWHSFMKSRLGWEHLLGARGNHQLRLHQLSEAMDYSSYEDLKPSYGLYLEAFGKRPGKPVFLEDRFRINQGPAWADKDYSYDETRRGMWHSALAGGSANIWGDIQANWIGHSHPYPAEVVEQLRTYARFFDGRFTADLSACNELVEAPQGTKYPVLQSTDEVDAVIEAATWARNNLPEYFKQEWLDEQYEEYARGQAYHMMTHIINALRANGWDTRRTLANPGLPPTNPYRWGSDALVIGPQGNVYDVYGSWPYPANPQAAFHGGGAQGEVTSDLIPIGGGAIASPSTGVCLGNVAADRLVFYVEDSDALTMKLGQLKGRRWAVAVDTRRPYEELSLGFVEPQDFTWTAPYASDWAIAVGDFAGGREGSLLGGEGPATLGLGSRTDKLTPAGERRLAEEYAAIGGIEDIRAEADAEGNPHTYLVGPLNGAAAEYRMELGGEYRFLEVTAKADRPGPVYLRIYVDGEPVGFVSMDGDDDSAQTKSLDVGQLARGPHYVAVELANDTCSGGLPGEDRSMYLEVLRVSSAGEPLPARASLTGGAGPSELGSGEKDERVTRLGATRVSERYFGLEGISEIAWETTPNGESHNYVVCASSGCRAEYRMELGAEYRRLELVAKADRPGPVLANVYVDGQKVGTASFDRADNNNQSVTVDLGSHALGVHFVAVELANDEWDGTGNADGDRNLYLDTLRVGR